MGSITKTFVAVCVLRLRDAGRLDLTDRFGTHVPGSALDDVTVEQLLTHAAGAQAETSGPWWERTPGGDWDDLVASPVGQRFRAGRRFHYSNVGLRGARRAARGGARTRLGGGRARRAARAARDDPHDHASPGSAAPGLAVHPFADVLLPEPEHDAGAMAPAGQLWTTVTDLARWATFLGGDTSDLLSADTLAEMVEPHHVVDDPGQPWVAAHGLGFQVWNVDGAAVRRHGGSMPGFLAGSAGQAGRRCGGRRLGIRREQDRRRGSGPVSAAAGDGWCSSPTPRRPRRPGRWSTSCSTGSPATSRAGRAWSAGGDPALLELVGTWHWGPRR